MRRRLRLWVEFARLAGGAVSETIPNVCEVTLIQANHRLNRVVESEIAGVFRQVQGSLFATCLAGVDEFPLLVAEVLGPIVTVHET